MLRQYGDLTMSADSTQDELLIACRRIGEAMDLFDEAACRSLGIGRSDLRALNLLEDGPIGASEIARRLGLTKASVTSLIDRLQRANYVARRADDADRRAVLVELQPATWQALARIYRPLGLHVAASTTNVTGAHRRRVSATLRQLGAAFDEARSGLGRP